MSAYASGLSAARGDAPIHGSGLSAAPWRSAGFPGKPNGFSIGGKDREVDHGEEGESEEEIGEKEEGRSGPQK